MVYIVHRRFKNMALCGSVNLPAMTKLNANDESLFLDGKIICRTTSENAHQYFARDDDGKGMERGKLTQAIQKTLSKRDTKYQERWNKVWEDSICKRFKRSEFEDHWLWNHDFFNAEIETLKYIASLVGAKT